MAEGTGGVDIATLGLRVDGRDVDRATQSLKEFTAEGERAEQTAKKLGSSVEQEARQVRKVQDIYARAARERQETERIVAAGRVSDAATSARKAAEAYVAQQEAVFNASMARIKEAQARGFLSPSEAAEQGRIAAMEYNASIVQILDRAPGIRRDEQAFQSLAGSLKNVGSAGRTASLGMSRLNFTIASLARQAVGAHPALGQLANVVSTFAVGSVATVGVLAGIAAIGLAWRNLTQDARDAKEEHERLLDILRDIETRRRIEALGPGGEAVAAVESVQSEIARLQAEIASLEMIGPDVGGLMGQVGPMVRITQLREQIEELRKLQVEGEEEIADETAAIRARARRDDLRIRQSVEAAARAHQERLTKIAQEAEKERAADRRNSLRIRLRVAEVVNDRIEKAEAERAKARRDSLALRLRVAEVVATREEELRKEAERAEAELQRAREKALNSLVQALNNVGRAYGGVTDQVLGLVSAVLSLESMPMDTPRDRLTAFGTSAATGAAFGATTASPFLGAVGGAAAGSAMAGPWGAVLGGVSGLVSGLFGQAQKAEEAARIEKEAARQRAQALENWHRAVEAFGGATDRIGEGEFQQRVAEWRELAEVPPGFGAGVSGSAEEWLEFVEDIDRSQIPESFLDSWDDLVRLVEQWREFVAETMQQFKEDLDVRLLRAQGRDEEADALRLKIQHEREYTEAVRMGVDAQTLALLETVQAEEKLAQARRDEVDAINAVTQALNAPQGLNLALLTYRASLAGPGRGDRIDGLPFLPGRASGPATGPSSRNELPVEIRNEFHIYDAGDPRRTARLIVDELGRQARTGGGDPFSVPRR